MNLLFLACLILASFSGKGKAEEGTSVSTTSGGKDIVYEYSKTPVYICKKGHKAKRVFLSVHDEKTDYQFCATCLTEFLKKYVSQAYTEEQWLSRDSMGRMRAK